MKRDFSPSNPDALRRSDFLLLVLVGLVVFSILIILQPVPGYMDASYYYATGIQLAEGRGFSEPFIWNYLNAPQSLPHPSHSYWYPLASMLAAFGMAVTGSSGFLAARFFFFLAALTLPPAVAFLSWRLTGMRRVATISGLLAIFCGYYLPFLLTTDNYALYMLLGAIYFLLLEKFSKSKSLLLGLISGLINLARADGLLWLPLTLVAVTVLTWGRMKDEGARTRLLQSTFAGLLALLGYAMVMGPWFLRNWHVFGTLFNPGSSQVLWMTNYNQIFSYTPEIYTFSSWISQGWRVILSTRASALWENLGTAVMAQGSLVLLPFILLGAWKNRRLTVTKLAVFGWLALLLSESVLFPYASVRGGFFHAGAVFQPLWFVLAPLGLETLLVWFINRRKSSTNRQLVHLSLLFILAVLSVLLVKIRVVDSGWNEGEYRYLQADQLLGETDTDTHEIVMVINPPAYNAMTGRQAIVIPEGDLDVVLAAAHQFDAHLLLLESDHLPDSLKTLYQYPHGTPGFTYLGGFEDVRLFFIEPAR